MTISKIDDLLQNELDLVISEFLPGQLFSYFNLLLPSPDGSNISDLENHTISDFNQIDNEYLLDVYSGRVSDVRHVGFDRNGNNIYEKLGNPHNNLI